MENNARTVHEVSEEAYALSIAAGRFMEEKQIDGQDVAARIGRSNGYVSERINGKRFIDTQVLQGIADLAGIGLGSLMTELVYRISTRGQ